MKRNLGCFLGLLLVCNSPQLMAQHITSPKSHFGFDMGEDYQLANYTQMENYFLKLGKESNRVLIQEAGVGLVIC